TTPETAPLPGPHPVSPSTAVKARPSHSSDRIDSPRQPTSRKRKRRSGYLQSVAYASGPYPNSVRCQALVPIRSAVFAAGGRAGKPPAVRADVGGHLANTAVGHA